MFINKLHAKKIIHILRMNVDNFLIGRK